MSGQVMATGGVKSAEFSAVITRADGTVEDLGVIARLDPPEPNPLRRLIRGARRAFAPPARRRIEPSHPPEVPMHRIAIRAKDEESPLAAPFTWRRPFDDLEQAKAALAEAKDEYPAREFTHAIEQLVVEGEGDEATGTWTEVS